MTTFGGSTRLHWYAIEKKEVVNKNFIGINKLIKSMEMMGKESRQSINLTFSDYDDVADEIFEIDEIRKFVKVLLQKHPNIFYYLSQNLTNCLQNIILCYADFETFFVGEKKPINQYPIEDIINNNLPEQQVVIQVPSIRITQWKREVRKTALKYNDVNGGEIVCQDIEKVFGNKV